LAELTENLLRLKTAPGIGNAILWRLLREFGGADGIFGAPACRLARVRGMTPEKAESLLAAAAHDPRPEFAKARQAGIEIIPYDDPAYPKPLLHSFDPPVVLYVRGRLTPDDQVAVGIVGTRRASSHGRDKAFEFAAALARGGYTVVSGLALGIDTFAHLGALDAGGRTIGVLGCGFDHMYPEQNRDLALEMGRSGAVISEFPMATRPARDTFPVRNRIIAGLSLGLLVVEAPLRSGSLITARLANEIGRTVFVLPGRAGDPESEGCNRLIRDGAVMTTCPDDVFNELNPALPPPAPAERGKSRASRAGREATALPAAKAGSAGLFGDAERGKSAGNPPPAPPKLTEEEAGLWAALSDQWRSVDEISLASGTPAGKAAALLGMLRLRRLVEQGPGQMYRRK
jgi:DNA processing protein